MFSFRSFMFLHFVVLYAEFIYGVRFQWRFFLCIFYIYQQDKHCLFKRILVSPFSGLRNGNDAGLFSGSLWHRRAGLFFYLFIYFFVKAVVVLNNPTLPTGVQLSAQHSVLETCTHSMCFFLRQAAWQAWVDMTVTWWSSPVCEVSIDEISYTLNVCTFICHIMKSEKVLSTVMITENNFWNIIP